MNENLVQMQRFIRDLLDYDEQLIRKGHLNYTRKNFETAFIVVDKLGGSENLSNGKIFDGDNEKLTPHSLDQDEITVRFYGDGAFARGTTFRQMVKVQDSLELQQTLGITVYNPTGLIDVNKLTGQQYGNCYELSMKVSFNVSITIDTLKLETENLEFTINK